MKILFLDDDAFRCFLFQKHHPEAWIVKTAAEAIKALEGGAFDIVCLDHDLGDGAFQDSDSQECGMEVVRWIVANQPSVGRIVVHSWNTPASYRMVEALRDAGYPAWWRPFGRAMIEDV